MIERLGGSPKLANGTVIPLSAAVRAGDLLFVSGQLGLDDSGKVIAPDVVGQFHQIVVRLRAVLALANANLESVVKTTVWLTDAQDFPAFNAAYREYFGEHPPARSTVVSQLLIPGARIEIEAVAQLKR